MLIAIAALALVAMGIGLAARAARLRASARRLLAERAPLGRRPAPHGGVGGSVGLAAVHRRFHFDPATTLGWAVPLILIAPLAAFVIAVSSVRTRRGSANTAMLGTLLALAATLLVGWGLARRSAPFHASYVYFTSNVAFSGPTNFQNFEIDIMLHVDHLTVVALAVIELCVLLVLHVAPRDGPQRTGPGAFPGPGQPVPVRMRRRAGEHGPRRAVHVLGPSPAAPRTCCWPIAGESTPPRTAGGSRSRFRFSPTSSS